MTYEDFQKSLLQNGLTEQNFSQSDLDLAKRYPEFGVSISNLKGRYNNAKTPEQKILANEQANKLRQSYGGYQGGTNGSDFVADDMLDYQTKNQLAKVVTPDPFSYDYKNDDVYRSYINAARREGSDAMRDTLAKARYNGNGKDTSAGIYAANGAYNQYIRQGIDKIPELEQNAYARYLNQRQLDQNALAALETERSYQDAMRQQELADAMKAADMFGYVPENYAPALGIDAGTPTYTAQQAALAAAEQKRQQNFANGMNFANTFGYVPDAYADALGVEAETPTKRQREIENVTVNTGNPITSNTMYVFVKSTESGKTKPMTLDKVVEGVQKGSISVEEKDGRKYYIAKN